MCDKCDPRPLCLWCGDRPARRLPAQTVEEIQQPLFCTMFCAVRAAFYLVQHHKFWWCAECQRWHTDRATCAHVEPVQFTIPRETP